MNDINSQHSEILGLTTEIVAAHTANNALTTNELLLLIGQVYSTLLNVSEVTTVQSVASKQQPVVAIKKSITPEFLICLEDGKKLKMLKRHIKTAYNLTPDLYREKWGLPPDYPMVAPNYATQRRDLAMKIGLGVTHRKKRSKK